MKDYLFPDVYVDSVLDLPLEKIFALGIRAFIVDLDNTITEWNSLDVHEEIIGWIQSAKAMGFNFCLVSNNNRDRVNVVAENLQIPFVYKAGKPRRRAVRRALDVLQTSPEVTAMIGDQVFTDVLAGNRMNLFTILVVPINKREFLGTRFMRKIERFVLKAIVRAVKKGEINSAIDNNDSGKNQG